MRKINKIEPLLPSLPTRKKVAAYARVSVETERLHHSLSAQVSYYSELIQSNPEWEYVGVYSDWRTGLSIYLTPTEAAFLRQKIETRVPSSLLGYLLRNRVDVTKYRSFEEINEDLRDSVPEELRRTMALACDFNRLVYAARVRYNFLLSNGQNRDAVTEWQRIQDNMPHMMAVEIDDVLQTLHISNFRLRRFLTNLQTAFLAGDTDTADRILVEREIEIKSRSRAKLCRREDFANDAWIGGRWLDYRFPSAKRIILDICREEGAAHVQDQ